MLRNLFLSGLAIGTLTLTACAIAEEQPSASWGIGTGRRQVVRAEELRANCPGLMASLSASVDKIKLLRERDRTERAGPPATLAAALQRSVAGGDASKTAAELRRERARADAFNAALHSRNCKVVDVEALLAAGTERAAKAK